MKSNTGEKTESRRKDRGRCSRLLPTFEGGSRPAAEGCHPALPSRGSQSRRMNFEASGDQIGQNMIAEPRGKKLE